jgi:voltage-gated potassium channel
MILRTGNMKTSYGRRKGITFQERHTDSFHVYPSECIMLFTRLFIRIFFSILLLTSPVWGTLLFIILLLSVLFSRTEAISIGQALYFSFITALTVGYGDITPATGLGRVIAVLLAIIGVITSGIVVAVALQAVRLAYDRIAAKKGGGSLWGR